MEVQRGKDINLKQNAEVDKCGYSQRRQCLPSVPEGTLVGGTTVKVQLLP